MPERDWRTPLRLEDLLKENGAEQARVQAVVNRGHGAGISPEDTVLPPVRVTVDTATQTEKTDDGTKKAS